MSDHVPEAPPRDPPPEAAAKSDGDGEPSGSLAELFAAISELWEVDVEGTEMALRFEP